VNGDPLRCLHVLSGDGWAGAEVSAFHLITELNRRPGVRIEAAVLNPGELYDRLRDRGVAVQLFDETRNGTRALIRRLVRTLSESQTQLVHSHRYKEHLISAVASRRCGVFHLRSSHGRPPGLSFNGRVHGLAAWIDRVVARWAGSDWIAVSEDLATEIAGPRSRVTVVPNGIPLEAPAPDRATLEAAFGAGPAWWIGFVGRFEAVKRPDRFVRLIAALPESVGGRQVRGVMLGDGLLFEQTANQIAAAGLTERISLAGHRNDAERLIASLDLLILPSDHEGDPMVLLEAMRARVPVVASRVGSLCLLGDLPWIPPRGDEKALADAVHTLLTSDEERREWAQALYERFLQRGSIVTCADRVLELYRGSCAG